MSFLFCEEHIGQQALQGLKTLKNTYHTPPATSEMSKLSTLRIYLWHSIYIKTFPFKGWGEIWKSHK